MLVFICVITRPFLVFGVFVGLFRVYRRYYFLVGVILAKWGHFAPILAPRALTESVRESIISLPGSQVASVAP
jgi:hypothetical protein